MRRYEKEIRFIRRTSLLGYPGRMWHRCIILQERTRNSRQDSLYSRFRYQDGSSNGVDSPYYQLFIEGLKPISDATRELIAKKFKGAVGLNIGMSPALVIGHPATLVVSLLLIPVTILLAVVLPGNEFLPLAR